MTDLANDDILDTIDADAEPLPLWMLGLIWLGFVLLFGSPVIALVVWGLR